MTETTSNHSLKSVGSASRVSSDHRIRGHNGTDRSITRVHSVSDDLKFAQDDQYSYEFRYSRM